MEDEIFVELLDEGTPVWRPTLGTRLNDGTYIVQATDGYDATDESWAFPPGSRVVCERRSLSGKEVLVASRLAGAMAESA